MQKITKIVGPKEKQGKKGTFYSFYITLEDGTNGEIAHKSETAYTVGMEVDFERTQNEYGFKFKDKKPVAYTGGSKKNYEAEFIICAMTLAVNLHIGGKITSDEIDVEFDSIYKKMTDKLK